MKEVSPFSSVGADPAFRTLSQRTRANARTAADMRLKGHTPREIGEALSLSDQRALELVRLYARQLRTLRERHLQHELSDLVRAHRSAFWHQFNEAPDGAVRDDPEPMNEWLGSATDALSVLILK